MTAGDIKAGELRVAIIGAGPRGLGAAEALIERAAARSQKISVAFFDPSEPAGAGPNFDPRQSAFCLLNTPLHAIDLRRPGRAGEGFAAFDAWLPPESRDPDRYPARAELGAYLADRFAALSSAPPPGIYVTHAAKRVQAIEPDGPGWRLRTACGFVDRFDEVLLAPGQPETRPDPQIARWTAHARSTGATLMPAYPDRDLLEAAAGWTERTVAIRGLGLTLFDVLRILTLGLGGRFGDKGYIASGREPARILPFSRDGLPPAPKPAAQTLDRAFEPTLAETAAFEHAFGEAVSCEPDRALRLVCEAIVAPASRILRDSGGGSTASQVQHWLARERESPGAQETREARQVLRHAIAMAEGAAPPSAGYAIGQIWRKWQNALRRGFNPVAIAPETASALIDFDEGLKRFSYGPPVGSARELLALIEAGLVDLRAAEDPDIRLVGEGWRLVEGGEQATAQVMIDAVLPGPALETVADPLLGSLRDAGRLCPVEDGLGARTRSDALAIGRDGQAQAGLGLLGRMALGTVIAVDSIHDCFGEARIRWAEGVMRRAHS